MKWMVIMESGNPQQVPWCFPPDESLWGTGALSNCHWSAATLAAAAAPPPNMSLPCGGSHCLMSSNCTTNPTFCNFGKVVVPQCTFDNWLGDADRELGNATHPLTAHYRGQRMLNVTLRQIKTDLLSADATVLVVGADGGANFLYIAADRVGALLGVKDFAVVPVEGYWLNWNGYYDGYALQQVITGTNDDKAHEVAGGNAWKFMGSAYTVLAPFSNWKYSFVPPLLTG